MTQCILFYQENHFLLSKYSMYLHIETTLIHLCPKRKDFHTLDMITNSSYGISSSVDEIAGSKQNNSHTVVMETNSSYGVLSSKDEIAGSKKNNLHAVVMKTNSSYGVSSNEIAVSKMKDHNADSSSADVCLKLEDL